MPWRRFVIALIPTTLAYFLAARIFQDRIVYTPPPVQDIYAGYPFLPEPFEIPLYLASYLVIPVVALAVAALSHRRGGAAAATIRVFFTANLRRITTIALIAAVLAGAVLAPRLFSFAQVYLAKHDIGHALWLLFTKRLYIVRVSLAAGLAAFLAAAYWRPPLASGWRRFEASRLLPVLLPILALAVAFIIMDPNFPYVEGNTNYVLGPASEILYGRPVLYGTYGLYGVLNTYLVTLVMALVPSANIHTFALVAEILYLAFIFGLYALARRWMNSRAAALLAAWLGLIVGFFLLSDPYITAYDSPGQNVYRQGFYLLPALLITWYGATRKAAYRELALMAAGLGILWNAETGIYLSAATLVAISAAEFGEFQRPLRQRFVRIGGVAVRQMGYTLAVFGLTTIVNFLVVGRWPDWVTQFSILTAFEGGYGKLPMPGIGLYQAFIVIYLAAFGWVAYRWIRRQSTEPMVPFLATYGALSFLYYVGNSAWSYLNFISLPALLLLVYACVRALSSAANASAQRLAAAVIVGLLAFAGVMTMAKLPVIFFLRDYAHAGLTAVKPSDEPFHQDAEAIAAMFSQNRVPLLHQDDGKLLLMAGKVNWFDLRQDGRFVTTYFDDAQVIYPRQIDDFIAQVKSGRPLRVLVTTKQKFGPNQPDQRIADFEAGLQQAGYTVERTLNTLKVYRRPQ
ncbi:MAG: hypothetical protein PHI63_06455 [Patescibacteria group bacterium]|nr:hypothetical protein [Patescibacteria group bacterium]